MTQISLAHFSFKFLSLGAIIQEFRIGDQNIVLSFGTEESYLSSPYVSQTVGRVANRISKGLIENLNGNSYQLAVNDNGVNHLHGGTVGWGHKKFSGPQHVTRNGRDAVHLTYLSPDGDENYPGKVELRVWYFAHEVQTTSFLEIEYEVEMIGNECDETVVNITCHPYFNIGGGPTTEGTKIKLATNEYLELDDLKIPTGNIIALESVEKDHWFTLSDTEPSFDHCLVMDTDTSHLPVDTRQRNLRQLASTYHPATDIHLEVYSTEPAFQFYTGCVVDGVAAATGDSSAGESRTGFCIEPGRFINAVNEPKWRGQVVLGQGQIWGSKIVYKAWKA